MNTRKIGEFLAKIVPDRIGFFSVIFIFIAVFIAGLFKKR